jgi:hypothetical protein
LHVSNETAPTSKDQEPALQGVHAVGSDSPLVLRNVPALHEMQVKKEVAAIIEDHDPSLQLMHAASLIAPSNAE